MCEKAATFYWAAVGALAGFGPIDLMGIGGPFVLAGAVLALVGLLLLRTRGTWAFFVGFSGLPALVFLLHVFNGVRSEFSPDCDQSRGPGAPAPPGMPDSVSCSFVPASYYAMFAVMDGGRALRGGPGSLSAAYRPPGRFSLGGSPRGLGQGLLGLRAPVLLVLPDGAL